MTGRASVPVDALPAEKVLHRDDGVEIEPPFSRVDIYIGADAKIVRTVIDKRYWARFGAA